jgi:hypothetical protein
MQYMHGCRLVDETNQEETSIGVQHGTDLQTHQAVSMSQNDNEEEFGDYNPFLRNTRRGRGKQSCHVLKTIISSFS